MSKFKYIDFKVRQGTSSEMRVELEKAHQLKGINDSLKKIIKMAGGKK